MTDRFDSIANPDGSLTLATPTIAWKIFRLRRDGSLGPLFVERDRIIPIGEWLDATLDIIPKGLSTRPGWHCASTVPPHIKLGRLASGEVRVLARVEIRDFELHYRPEAQGGLWFTSRWLKVLEVLS